VYVTVREQVATAPAPDAAGVAPAPQRARSRAWGPLSVPAVSRNVLFLGLTSLLTDVSSEMVATILPLYLVLFLGLSPLQFGVVDGMYQGFAALVRIGSGYVADRWQRYKELAVTGYGLSALCKLGLLAAGSAWMALAGVVLVDRTGKGIRTAPRDALISLSTPPAGLATAFGVHRSLDTLGAMLGPVVAFALLARLPEAFDAVFVVSFLFAVLGLGVLVLFVENRPPVDVTKDAPGVAPRTVSLRAAFGLLNVPAYRSLALAGAMLAFCTVSDGFLYLVLQRRLNLNTGLFPLLYVGTSLCYFLLAVPAGRLADRWGRGRVLLAGYALLVPLYVVLLLPDLGFAALALVLLLFGAYYAATDGVLMACASATLGPELRTTGLGLLTTCTTVARLLASVLFGAVWTAWGVEQAIVLFGVGLLLVLGAAAVILARGGQLQPALATSGDSSLGHFDHHD
jgi:MFS family permease